MLLSSIYEGARSENEAPAQHGTGPDSQKPYSKVSLDRGLFVISLDFELHWGVCDKLSIRAYRDNLLGVRKIVPALLKLFAEYGIHATWATVGFLFFENKLELLSSLPEKQPNYARRELSAYAYLQEIGDSERDDPFHYAPSLIRQIAAAKNQEVGTHTFSHYYCLERAHDEESFRADLDAALRVARDKHEIDIRTIVFPRNQVNRNSLLVCRDLGIRAYRDNVTSWLYAPRSIEDETTARRGVRLLDAYLEISGTNAHELPKPAGTLPCNVPASRYLRPYWPRLKAFEPLRLRRIVNDLTRAAERKQLYHLWWHPHDFGARPKENLAFLTQILDCFAVLRERHNMESVSMQEAAELLMTDAVQNPCDRTLKSLPRSSKTIGGERVV
jgi:peptidoglycan/xylan/chitin deacetylase (PgdA/CDA1 family)